ncbi:TetR/AcrR family transcriptional regulator [Gorillibacterium sp. sgz5001074]|uniref:TetR/AcrR family transcriptional regulator n=1 Tax=Gorillibacterium sp. sgz5001074 TaxID=3446695 RepID=UPI003F6677AC
MAADKREQILWAAIKLFAEKGFHSTSIQEIADAAGVAKGSTYLYFKSKDAILLSVFTDYYGKMFDDIMNAPVPDLSPRDRLKAQIRMQLEKFIEFKDFLKMQMREQFIHQNEDIKKAAVQMRIRGLLWLQEQIQGLYGEEIRPWSLDCTSMFQSVMSGYIGNMILHGIPHDLDELADFLIGRLDDLVAGLLRDRPKPMLGGVDLHDFLQENPAGSREDKLRQLFRQIRELAEADAGESEAAEDLTASLQVLEEELQKPRPKRVIVQGMVTLLQQSGISGMKKLVKQLQAETAAALERASEG